MTCKLFEDPQAANAISCLGVIRWFKLLLEQLPTNKQSADEIVHMAWFNPDVAAYLLERPVKNANVPAYNINLRRLLAADNAVRESAD
ncbi:MAG: hypothetical protein JWQ24_453 [Tardiphaga sp.]|nr:hypothetical protein [Tardiphaga sp.]